MTTVKTSFCSFFLWTPLTIYCQLRISVFSQLLVYRLISNNIDAAYNVIHFDTKLWVLSIARIIIQQYVGKINCQHRQYFLGIFVFLRQYVKYFIVLLNSRLLCATNANSNSNPADFGYWVIYLTVLQINTQVNL